jgi:hypothetical protein
MWGALGSADTNPHALGRSDSKSNPDMMNTLTADRAPERVSRQHSMQKEPTR